MLRPHVVEGVEKIIELRRQKAKSYHDRTAHRLPQLEVGQEVRVARLQKRKTWQAGTLVEQLSDRSYRVKTGSETIRRNRQFLKLQEGSTSSIASKVPLEVAKEQFVAAPPNRKEGSSNLPDTAPRTSTDPVSVASSDPVPDISRRHRKGSRTLLTELCGL